MSRIASFVLLLSVTASASNNYTLVFTNTQNIQNAKSFIKKHFKDNQEDIHIVKYKDRYRVTYGAFDSKAKANKFQKSLPWNLKKLDKFMSISKDENIVEIIKSKKTKVIKPVSTKKETFVKPIEEINKTILNDFTKNNYTYVFSSMSSVKKAKNFVNLYLKDHTEDIYIVKYKRAYRVSYGAFPSKTQAKQFYRTLPDNIKKLDKFLVRNDFDLKTNMSNVVEVISNTENKSSAKTQIRAIEPEIKVEVLEVKKEEPKVIVKKPIVLSNEEPLPVVTLKPSIMKKHEPKVEMVKTEVPKLIKKAVKKTPYSPYTYVFSNMKDMKNAKNYVNKHLKNNIEDVYIIKHKNRYRVSYGAFTSKAEANKFKKSLPYNVKKLDKFLVKNSFDLISDDKNVVAIMDTNGKWLYKKDRKLQEEVLVKNELIPKVEDKSVDKKEKTTETKVVKEKFKNRAKPKAEEKSKENKAAKKVKESKLSKNNGISFGVDFEYSPLALDNKFTYGAGGSNISTSSDLKLDSYSQTVIPKLFLNYGNHSLFASYLGYDQSSTTTLDKDITFSSITYNAGEKVTSKFDSDWFISGYRYKFKDIKFGIDIHDYTNSFSINKSHVKKEFIFPALGFNVKHDFENYSLLYGGSYGKKSNELTFFDYYLGVGVDDILLPSSSISLGYKNRELEIKDNEYDGKSTYSGGYLNFEKSF